MPLVQRLERAYPQQQGLQAGAHSLQTTVAGRCVTPTFDAVCASMTVAMDLLAFSLIAAGWWLAWRPAGVSLTSFMSVGCVFTAVSIAFFSVRCHYDQRMTSWLHVRDIIVAAALSLTSGAACAFFLDLSVPKVALLAAALVLPALLFVLRGAGRGALKAAGAWDIPVVLVAGDECQAEASRACAEYRKLGYNVVAVRDVPRHGETWSSILRATHSRLLVIVDGFRNDVLQDTIADMVRERVPYAILSRTCGLPVGGAQQTSIGSEFIMTSYRNTMRRSAARAIKVALDVGVALIALFFLAPLMAIVAAIVALDGGPVFFAHQRLGAQGRLFNCLKFRSMVVDSDNALQRLFATDQAALAEWTQCHKLRNDPRITWIGKVLRKTSLDELPQLLNVLRLEMSLVGPRPIVSLEIPKYAQDIAYYYEARPGITGLWQISGRSDTTYEQRVRLDSWYVRNWSLWQDFVIIARTVPAVVLARGAG